ncbi:DNA-processing protein DprA [Kistimonas scapharcae]|uniref:DNA-processing protein DprA n=1 Tax=Kistimonas scapharcae TaxID=1036133 RepID=A0ABP8V6Y4_9GAMM
MSFSEDTQAILLLNTRFTKPASGDASPLTVAEWKRFAIWMKDKGLSPSKLLRGELSELLNGWQDKKVTVERIQELLDRGNAMALALEKWERAGIWLITRTSADKDYYPAELKRHLGVDSPALFFGVGNKDLLNQPGIAVVGSRSATHDDLQFSAAFGAKCAAEGFSVISGGAKGVDEAAMLGALEAEGTSVGVLANGLLQAATSAKWRQHLMNNNLALITPFSPEASFSKYDLMARNKYVYSMSKASIVVHSGQKGGTWSGAEENLKKGWVPLWVKPTSDPKAGNTQIVAQGGKWCDGIVEKISIASLAEGAANTAPETGTLDFIDDNNPELFEDSANTSVSQPDTLSDVAPSVPQTSVEAVTESPTVESIPTEEPAVPELSKTAESPTLTSYYQCFLKDMAHISRVIPQSEKSIADTLGLHKSQVKEWITKALTENLIVKTTRPTRYQWVGDNKE